MYWYIFFFSIKNLQDHLYGFSSGTPRAETYNELVVRATYIPRCAVIFQRESRVPWVVIFHYFFSPKIL